MQGSIKKVKFDIKTESAIACALRFFLDYSSFCSRSSGGIFRRIFGRRGCRERGLFAFHFMDAAAFDSRRAERQAGADDDIHIIAQNAPDQHGGESRPAREVVREDEIKGNFARARVAGGGDERHRGVQDAHDLRKVEPFAETVHVRQVVAEGFQREVGDGKH